MGKLLFFDAFNGVSGDMILGALLDLGLPLAHLEQELRHLELGGYRLGLERVERQGLRGANFRVELVPAAGEGGHAHAHEHPHPHGHSHRHEHQESAGLAQDQSHPGQHGHAEGRHQGHAHGHVHGHHHRTWAQIRKMIQDSRLEAAVRDQALAIFERLARAEATVHGTSVEEVHFHEVGAVDSIVDIVGACIGFRYLGVDEFYSSPLNLGGGTVTFSHGTWPVPAPATVELVRGFPTRLSEIPHELTTPTGAAIVTTLVDPRRPVPPMRVQSSGWGAGDREIPGIPNMLRLLVAESLAETEAAGVSGAGWGRDQVALLEANVDDVEPETLGYFLELAFRDGALDVFFSPIQMKKNRPAVLLSVLCRPEDRERMVHLIFRETTTLGVRGRLLDRWVLSRREEIRDTEFGPVRVKVAELDGRPAQAAPEYEELKRIAQESGLPLREVRRRIMARL
ncbi:MAG: hypothetical protein Kow001_10030 [Acidobacteriota bacterium]